MSESEAFILENSKEAVGDWVMALPLYRRKHLVMTLFVSLKRRHKIMEFRMPRKRVIPVTGFAGRTVAT